LKVLLIVGGYFLFVTIFLAAGVCLLITPQRFLILLDRLAKVELWSKPSLSTDAKEALHWRIAGLLMTLMASYMLIDPFLHIEHLPGAPPLLRAAPHRVGLILRWGIIPLLFLLLSVGLSFLLRPIASLNTFAPRRIFTTEATWGRLFVVRVIGLLMSLVALLGIVVELTHK